MRDREQNARRLFAEEHDAMIKDKSRVYILAHAKWPLPILPLKNHATNELGIMCEHGSPAENGQWIVMIGCLGITDWTKAPRTAYQTVDDVLEAGWRVD